MTSLLCADTYAVPSASENSASTLAANWSLPIFNMMSPRIQEREFILTRMQWKWLQNTAASGKGSPVMNFVWDRHRFCSGAGGKVESAARCAVAHRAGAPLRNFPMKKDYLEAAIETAQEAGKILREEFDQPAQIT